MKNSVKRKGTGVCEKPFRNFQLGATGCCQAGNECPLCQSGVGRAKGRRVNIRLCCKLHRASVIGERQSTYTHTSRLDQERLNITIIKYNTQYFQHTRTRHNAKKKIYQQKKFMLRAFKFLFPITSFPFIIFNLFNFLLKT